MFKKVGVAGRQFPPVVKIIALLLLGGVLAGVGYLALTGNNPAGKATQAAASSSSAAASPEVIVARPRPVTMQAAQRIGRCRALDVHLTHLSQARDAAVAEAALKALGLLAGEMMNGYSGEPVQDPGSRASLAVYSPEGRSGLNEARDALRTTLRGVRGLDGSQAASRISASCGACHSRFMRDGGRELVLLGQ